MKEIIYFLEDSLNLDNTKEDNIYNLRKEYPDTNLSEGVLNDHIREVFAYIKNRSKNNDQI